MKIFFILFLGMLCGIGCAQNRPQLRAATGEEIDRIQGPVLFDFNRWTVREDQTDLLSKKADLIKSHPHVMVILEGHADPVGSEEYNLQLGDRRARQVKLELVNRGVEPTRLVVVSYGETRPREAGRSEEAHRNDRRVEFVVK